ncbi:MAG: hypothetical protein RR330_01315 [Alistipes sp.]
MKKTVNVINPMGGGNAYPTPTIEALNIAVEQGFSASTLAGYDEVQGTEDTIRDGYEDLTSI